MYIGNSSREDALGNGTLFDKFTVRMDNKKSGRRKQVIDTRNEGFFYVHNCFDCSFGYNIRRDVLRIAHFKVKCTYHEETEKTYTLKQYTKEMKRIIALLL